LQDNSNCKGDLVFEEWIGAAIDQKQKDLETAEYNLQIATKEWWQQCSDKKNACIRTLSDLHELRVFPQERGFLATSPSWGKCHNCWKEGPYVSKWGILCPSCSVEHYKHIKR
jgi:hypothetical protein